MRPGRFELPRSKRTTRPSTLRADCTIRPLGPHPADPSTPLADLDVADAAFVVTALSARAPRSRAPLCGPVGVRPPDRSRRHGSADKHRRRPALKEVSGIGGRAEDVGVPQVVGNRDGCGTACAIHVDVGRRAGQSVVAHVHAQLKSHCGTRPRHSAEPIADANVRIPDSAGGQTRCRRHCEVLAPPTSALHRNAVLIRRSHRPVRRRRHSVCRAGARHDQLRGGAVGIRGDAMLVATASSKLLRG